MDYFEMDNSYSYLITVDRYSGWSSVFYFKPGQATAHKLLSTLRNLFATLGIPEEVQMVAHNLKQSSSFTFSKIGKFIITNFQWGMPNLMDGQRLV